MKKLLSNQLSFWQNIQKQFIEDENIYHFHQIKYYCLLSKSEIKNIWKLGRKFLKETNNIHFMIHYSYLFSVKMEYAFDDSIMEGSNRRIRMAFLEWIVARLTTKQ